MSEFLKYAMGIKEAKSGVAWSTDNDGVRLRRVSPAGEDDAAWDEDWVYNDEKEVLRFFRKENGKIEAEIGKLYDESIKRVEKFLGRTRQMRDVVPD